MKKPFFPLLFISFCLVITAFSPLFFGGITAKAESGEYGRIINDATPFYKDADKTQTLFYLPYTYYVKVLGEENDLFKIECGGKNLPAIYGYTEKDALFFDGLPVENPYPDIKIKTINDAPIFSDGTLTAVSQFVFAERELSLYGAASDGKGSFSYYVAYNGKLGYIKEEDIYPFKIENHPNELTFIRKPDSDNTPAENRTADNSGSNGLKLAVILSLVLAGVVALFVSLFPKKKKSPSPEISDDGETE